MMGWGSNSEEPRNTVSARQRGGIGNVGIVLETDNILGPMDGSPFIFPRKKLYPVEKTPDEFQMRNLLAKP